MEERTPSGTQAPAAEEARPGAASPEVRATLEGMRRAREGGVKPRSGRAMSFGAAALALGAAGVAYWVQAAGAPGGGPLAASGVEEFQAAAPAVDRIEFPEFEPEPPAPVIEAVAPDPTPSPALDVAAPAIDPLGAELDALRRALRESEEARAREARERDEAQLAAVEELRAVFVERREELETARDAAQEQLEAYRRETEARLSSLETQLNLAEGQREALEAQLVERESALAEEALARQAAIDDHERAQEEALLAEERFQRQVEAPAVVFAAAGGGTAAGTGALGVSVGGAGGSSALARPTTDEAYLASAPAVQTAVAERLTHPDRTLAQGSVIQAVLQTRINSDRPGSVVAVVSDPVQAFTGEAVLVPRGSRLFGTYRAGIERGEARILVRWSRILTPDGTSMEISAVGGDRLGTSGLSGFVDTKFRERFGGAALISIIGAAPAVAAAQVDDGATSDLVLSTGDDLEDASDDALAQQLNIAPTIHVAQGAAVTVLVDRDVVVHRGPAP